MRGRGAISWACSTTCDCVSSFRTLSVLSAQNIDIYVKAWDDVGISRIFSPDPGWLTG